MLGGGAGIPTGGFASPDARAWVGFVFEPSHGDATAVLTGRGGG